MPPKSKGTGKKSAKARTPTLIDGLTKEEMSKEQLEEHIVRLREELDREREERNYFQLERDKIHTFWEISNRQLEEVKADLKNLDKDVEEDEQRHQVEIKVYKQKMKHLLCEHQNTLSELKAHAEDSAEAVKKQQEQLETALHNEKGGIMADMQELDNENLIRELELKHEEEITKTTSALEKQLTEIKVKYEQKITTLAQELDNMRINEIREREDHWNSHITGLIEDHNKALSDANVLVYRMQQDLEMNTSLKTQIKNMKMKQKEKEKDQKKTSQDNKRLTELLTKDQEEIDEIDKKMKCHGMNEDTDEKVREKELNDMKREYEALEQKFSKLQQERDELYKNYSQTIQKVQDEAGLKSMKLEKKIQTLTDSLEKTQTQLSSVLAASNMDHTALSGVMNKIKENFDSSNNSIKILQYQKAQISRAQKDLQLAYEAKLRALGVPVEDLCAEPFESPLPVTTLRQELDLDFAL